MEKKEQGVTIGDIFLAIKRNIIGALIVGAVLFAVGLAYTFGIVKEKYRSTGKLIVAVSTSSGSVDYNTSLRLVQTVSELVETNGTINEVVSSLKADGYTLTAGEIKDMLTTSYSTTSFMITVNATYTDPVVTEKVVNYSMKSLVDECNTNETLKIAFANSVAIPETASKGSYYSPNKLLYALISFLVAGVFALLYVLIVELIGNKFRNRKDVEKTLGLNVVGIFEDNKKLAKDENKKELIDIDLRSMSPYNKLLTNIRYSSIDKSVKAIMFTSTKTDELKSYISSNLALVMAENKKKVCLIDLDLYRPQIHKTFELDREKGISEYIIGDLQKKDIIKSTKYGVDVITAGVKVNNTNVIIESKKLADFVQELKETYDYIIIDTPPAVTSEAIAVSKIVDGMIYNIAIRESKKSNICACLDEFSNVKANVIGICLTKYNEKQADYYYGD